MARLLVVENNESLLDRIRTALTAHAEGDQGMLKLVGLEDVSQLFRVGDLGGQLGILLVDRIYDLNGDVGEFGIADNLKATSDSSCTIEERKLVLGRD